MFHEVMTMSAWQDMGQPIGTIDELMPSIYEGVLTIKREWDTILKEQSDRSK